MDQLPPTFWNISADEMLQKLQSAKDGLSSDEAQQRLEQYGVNLLKPRKRKDALALLLVQFGNPIILILLFATVLSFFLHDRVDSVIILSIVIISGMLGFWQEYSASNAIEKLLSIVQVKTEALRDGSSKEILAEEIVPGDIVNLGTGDIIPGDSLILESHELFVDESALTGETFPVEKEAAVLPENTPLAQRTNALWMGTHVKSGSAKILVVRTGKKTEFGKISERLKHKPEKTEFEHGIQKFGYFLMVVTLILVVAIFVINILLKRPILDSFLFSLALAVGLTPQLLPAIISINLSHGAKRMAQQKVIVKRLASIENFGSMNVLCADKTGTLTEGIVHLQSALDMEGNSSDKVLLYAYLNAYYKSAFTNPIDDAIRKYRKFDLAGYKKLDEIQYDFKRKRLSILVSLEDTHLMITKGALKNVLGVCSSAEAKDGKIVKIKTVLEPIQEHFKEFSNNGLRTLGIAFKDMGSKSQINKEDEADMTFLGFLLFLDPPKRNILKTIKRLKKLGVELKVITGDNQLVAANISQQVGVTDINIITGSDLDNLNDKALKERVTDADVFAEIEPNQKEQIIIALKKAGNVVGFLGDGINDASALHAADVGISVNSAVDVAKDAADIVLLKKDLDVLTQGVRNGRSTFANTLKYVFMATSANFGNMFSMAGISLIIPFLPLLPKQILLTNLMTDIPEMTIATDRVDKELVDHPRRWDIRMIRKFMITFGLISSIFDYFTFGVLLFIFHAKQLQFRTGWFMESVISASIIVLVIRSRKPFFTSTPGKYLLMATLSIVVATLIFPFTPINKIFGFKPPSILLLLLIGVIVFLYIISAEIAKKIFYKKVDTKK